MGTVADHSYEIIYLDMFENTHIYSRIEMTATFTQDILVTYLSSAMTE